MIKSKTRINPIILLPLLLLLMSCGTQGISTQSLVALETEASNSTPDEPPQDINPQLTSPPGNSKASKPQDQPNADVLHVRAVKASDGTWTFHVTISHPDTGWDDYADGWDVLTPDGTVLKNNPDNPFTRLLTHPHVDEQPFTRSQSRIIISLDVNQVRVRAHDIVSGFGGLEVLVDLTLDSGPGFEVEP